MRQPRSKMYANLAVVLPNFAAMADRAVTRLKRMVDCFLIIRGLKFIDIENVAGLVNYEDTKPFHLNIERQEFLKTLIWINLST